VLYALSARYGRQFWPVHRLDEEVSGILVFAKNAEAHRRLCGLFEARTAKKEYEAYTTSSSPALAFEPGAPALRFEDLLARGKRRAFVAPHGKQALTLASPMGEIVDGESTVQRWILRPQTGRSHQLRVQLALRGYPIVGDALYGSTRPFVPDGIALRAVRLDVGFVVEATSLAALADQSRGAIPPASAPTARGQA
jgi:tRNA pseudouridine32 synthase/23S rRNA pseudouridine746 synthase